MRTATRTARQPLTSREETAVARQPVRLPLPLVVAGSLLAGALAALALIVTVLTGAAEAVVTGASLLSFAAGWALLAAASTRFTTRPQRWALVPAAAMGVTGLGLVAFAPGEDALAAAGWVWPPAALALAAWTWRAVRRAHVGASRWLLYPVVGALAVASLGGLYESVALSRDQQRYAMPGASYAVNGHRLHLNCSGTGSPTVVLAGGLGEPSPIWARIAPAVAGTTRVCAYDRAGQGWSGDAARPQDSVAVAADLHALLAAAGEQGPYVLAGHSAGGVYAMTYAARYPGEVAGLVLLDSSSPRQFSVMPDFPRVHALVRRWLTVAPSLARLGVMRMVPAPDLPAPADAQFHAFSSSPRDVGTQRDEQSVYRTAFAQALQLTTLGSKPLVVLTATQGQPRGWAAAQDELAALSSSGSHRTADTTHAEMLDSPAGSTASVRAINDVLAAVRTGASPTNETVAATGRTTPRR